MEVYLLWELKVFWAQSILIIFTHFTILFVIMMVIMQIINLVQPKRKQKPSHNRIMKATELKYHSHMDHVLFQNI